MAELQSLDELLVDKMKGFISNNGRRFAILKECGIESKLKRIDVYDVPEGSILINLDRYDQPDSLFKNHKGQRKRCDYVLVTTVENRDILLFIEMKSARIKNIEIEQQFKGAECVIDYCDAVLNRFHGQDNLLKKHIKRFVIFYKSYSIAKRPTRPPKSPQQSNDIPKRAYLYPDPIRPSLHTLVYLSP
jgi:hypothetical protein